MDQTVIILGVCGIILGLIAGFYVCKSHFQNRVMKMLRDETLKQNSFMQKLFNIMSRDGLNVKQYIDRAAEEQKNSK